MTKKSVKNFKPIRILLRLKYALTYYVEPLAHVIRWSTKDTENHNFLYPLSELNSKHLIHFIANTFSIPVAMSQLYFNEISTDELLTQNLLKKMRQINGKKDSFPFFGRRIGWYMIVRILKPRVIFESGVFEGLGAAVVISALKRNQAEGFQGKYFGTDITLGSGSLLSLEDFDFGQVIIGDSAWVLKHFDKEIDLFISDGDHAIEFEWSELNELNNKLAKHSCVISDNSHNSNVLAEWSIQHDRQFFFFKEIPEMHWYPGAGIGVSLGKRT